MTGITVHAGMDDSIYQHRNRHMANPKETFIKLKALVLNLNSVHYETLLLKK